MKKLKPGNVVIVPTKQAGTVWWIEEEVCVILRNGDLWYGPACDLRFPSSKEELAACPIDIDRWKKK